MQIFLPGRFLLHCVSTVPVPRPPVAAGGMNGYCEEGDDKNQQCSMPLPVLTIDCKSEIRSTKSETNSLVFKTRQLSFDFIKLAGLLLVFTIDYGPWTMDHSLPLFEFWSLGFVSNFGFRASDLCFPHVPSIFPPPRSWGQT